MKAVKIGETAIGIMLQRNAETYLTPYIGLLDETANMNLIKIT